MDALALNFPDASFDLVVAPYVVTTVPDAVGALDEMARVVRPGGEIIIVNHVSREAGPIAWSESASYDPGSVGRRPFAAVGEGASSR